MRPTYPTCAAGDLRPWRGPAPLAVGVPMLARGCELHLSALSALTAAFRAGGPVMERLVPRVAFSWQQWLEAALALAGQAQRIAGLGAGAGVA